MTSFEEVCYPLIAVIGVPVNLAAIVILCQGKCGLSICITRYLEAMAAADLMVVVIEVIFYQIILLFSYGWVEYDGNLDKMLLGLHRSPYCLVHYTLCHVALDCSVWLTVAFTFDRFVAICCFKLKAKYCTPKIASLVICTIYTGLCLKNIPFYFLYLKSATEYDLGSWVCKRRLVIPLSPKFDGFYWVDQLLNPLLPFFVILALNILTARQILMASRVRRSLWGQRNCEKQRDREMEMRRQSIILLFALSVSFLLCWATTTVCFILGHCLYMDLETSIRLYLVRERGAVIQLFSCCTNTFIYGVTQTRFREQLGMVVFAPARLIVRKVRQSGLRS